MSEYHEPWEALSPETKNAHRALKSLMEELEAVDWYNQRADLCDEGELKAVLAHNRDEEIEHACMLLEWLRRTMPVFDEQLRTYLFTKEPITHTEGSAGASDGGADLGIGKLTGGE
jgi:hypothetical protein